MTLPPSPPEKDRLESLPPACIIVYWVLANADRPLTSGEIADKAPVAGRNVPRAVTRLADVGLVRKTGVPRPNCPQYAAIRLSPESEQEQEKEDG